MRTENEIFDEIEEIDVRILDKEKSLKDILTGITFLKGQRNALQWLISGASQQSEEACIPLPQVKKKVTPQPEDDELFYP